MALILAAFSSSVRLGSSVGLSVPSDASRPDDGGYAATLIQIARENDRTVDVYGVRKSYIG